jgi:hypothetical protein
MVEIDMETVEFHADQFGYNLVLTKSDGFHRFQKYENEALDVWGTGSMVVQRKNDFGELRHTKVFRDLTQKQIIDKLDFYANRPSTR